MSTEATTADSGVAEESTESVESPIESGEAISEESGEGEEAIEAAPEEPSAPDPKFEVTVDGEKLLLTQDELIKSFQLGSSSYKRFKEAAQIKKEAEETLSSLRSNPIEAFLKAGGDDSALRAIAEEYLYNKIQYEKMSPEEQEHIALQKEVEALRKEKESETNRKQSEIDAQQTAQMQEEFSRTFGEALETAGVPSNEKSIAAIAKIQLEALEDGFDLPLELAVSQYKEEQNNLINSYLGSLDHEQLAKTIGKDKLDQIRKQEIAGLKNPVTTKGASAPPPVEASKKMSASEFFQSLKA